MSPVHWMRGKLAGSPELNYDGGKGYDVSIGDVVPAANYQPCLVAKVLRAPYRDRLRYFQIRTRSSVNMTAATHHNLAVMGGAGALFAALVRQKSSTIYIACVNACPKGQTLRSFVFPILHHGLSVKDANIIIAPHVIIKNPWITNENPNVPVSAAILAKFRTELSNN